ncbi:MFS transporter [Rhodococcus opacus]|uniref:MFS transporter n=1 Tax=Rhodococcus opacus TaxID=37919 RepID=UPI001C4442B3|nr:MFS transporter [Rhodococcus opacus]MBV6756661.1 MFS transporter [Rhodococcus opacus]
MRGSTRIVHDRPDRSVGDSPRSALAAAVLGFFVITLDAVIVNVALPSIRDDLGGGVTGMQWVVDGYTLVFAALLLSAGSLTDRIGATRAFAGGIVVFVTASLACGWAPTLTLLVVSRFVQGAAAAVMMPSSMALIRQAYPSAATRSRAIGMWAMGGAVAASSGPVLGGLFELVDWRLIFFVNIPVGAAALVLVMRTAASPRQAVPFDWAGQVAGVLAMSGLTFGLIEAGAVGFADERVLASLGVAAAALIAFVAVQTRVKHPMVPLDLFRSRTVIITLATGFAFMVGYFGLPFVFSLYLQQGRGLTALGAGLTFLPMMLCGAALTPFSAQIADRIGRRAVIVGGLATMTLGLVLLGVAPETTPLWVIAALMVLIGLGGPSVSPPATSLLIDSVTERQTGTASGVFNTSRQVGGALAVAVFGGLLAHPDRLIDAVHNSMLLAATVLGGATLAALFLRNTQTT